VILFDLDGTLLPPPSSERRFIRYLIRERRLGARQTIAAIAFLFRYFGRYGWRAYRRNKAYLSGLPVDTIAREAIVFIDAVLIPALDPAMVRILNAHRREGHPLALMTGAPHFIAGPLADRLGIDHVVATRCAATDGRFVATPPDRHPYGREKLALARALCRETGTDLGDVTAYADSWEDRFLLSAVGQAVAVRPGRRLRRLAEAEGWTIVPVMASGTSPPQPVSEVTR